MSRSIAALFIALEGCGGAAVSPVRQPADGGSAGPAPAAYCEVPAMDQIYPGAWPPNPYGPALPADTCLLAAHDAILVLGCPSNADGTPSDCQIRRADMAAALQRYSSHFIVSGAAAHNQYVEADALEALLVARGIPEAHILLDRKAMHTDENIYYGSRIMQAQGWQSALVVSDDPGHLVFTALCDSNCCVDLGRLTVMELPDKTKVGHYVLHPPAAQVSGAECSQIETSTKFMCTNMAQRMACAWNFRLRDP